MKQIDRFSRGAAILAALFCVAIMLGSAPILKAEENAAPAAKAETSIDTRIASFHERLKITPEQEEQWNKLAAVMRENAVALQAAIEMKNEKGPDLNAVDSLKSYSSITDAQAEGMHKFIPAFEALYAAMSEEQKKNADTVFTKHFEHKRTTKKK